MEFKEILSRLSIPSKPKANEEEQIKAEENNLSEVILNVIVFKLILSYSFPRKIQISLHWALIQKMTKRMMKVCL